MTRIPFRGLQVKPASISKIEAGCGAHANGRAAAALVLGSADRSASPVTMGATGGVGGRLGNNTKSATPIHDAGFRISGPTDAEAAGADAPDFKRSEARARRYELQTTARVLLYTLGKQQGLEYAYNYHRTCKCLYVSVGKNTVNADERGNAFYGGLPLCGSVWACPVCAAKIQERRRPEIAQAIDWAWTHGLKPVMVTLTFPHRSWHGLNDLITSQADALHRLRAGKPWAKVMAKVGFKGLIRSLELTHGGNGWHPHTHELWFVDQAADAAYIKERTLQRWTESCIRAGLLDPSDKAQLEAFHAHAVDVIDNCSNSDYLAKIDTERHWGADREISKGVTKAGSQSGRHPFTILETADFGNRDAELFLEYVHAMKGKRQIFWSHGLKELVGVEEKTDEELAEEELEKADVLATLTRRQWKIVIAEGARSEILDLAEAKGYEGLAQWFHRFGESLQRGLLPDDLHADDDDKMDWKINKACMKSEAMSIKPSDKDPLADCEKSEPPKVFRNSFKSALTLDESRPMDAERLQYAEGMMRRYMKVKEESEAS